jgi:hypothetical protein
MRRMSALLLFCLLLGITACSRSPEAATPVKLPKVTFTHDWLPELELGGYYAEPTDGVPMGGREKTTRCEGQGQSPFFSG